MTAVTTPLANCPPSLVVTDGWSWKGLRSESICVHKEKRFGLRSGRPQPKGTESEQSLFRTMLVQ